MAAFTADIEPFCRSFAASITYAERVVPCSHMGLLQGTCPLVEASSNCNWDAAQLLVRHGAQVNNADDMVRLDVLGRCEA